MEIVVNNEKAKELIKNGFKSVSKFRNINGLFYQFKLTKELIKYINK